MKYQNKAIAMRLINFIGCMIAFAIVSSGSANAGGLPISVSAGLTLPNVVKACLPTRAKPSYDFATGREFKAREMPLCNCPPKSLCDVANGRPNMPDFLALRCCQIRAICPAGTEPVEVAIPGMCLRTVTECAPRPTDGDNEP